MSDEQSGPAARGGRPGRVRSALAWFVLFPWLVALAAWAVGRVVGDRHLVTQYLEWIPTEAVALLGLVTALLVGVVRGRPARRARRARRAWATLGLSVGLAVYLVLGEWSLWRVVAPRPAGEALARVVFMNISPARRPVDLSPVFDAGGDIVVISNVHPQPISFEQIYGFPPSDFLVRTLGLVPGESPAGDVHALATGTFRVLSRWPIRRRAMAAVGRQETWLADDVVSGGMVAMVEIETPGGPLTVWAVDMPRTLGASRRDLFAEAASRIVGLAAVFEVDALGRWIESARKPGDRLFAPDVVVGDFNTPGHAWSVGRFAPSLRPARADAGMGPAGTWPHTLPLFEIDLARLGPSVRATAVRRLDVPGCRHLGLIVDLGR